MIEATADHGARPRSLADYVRILRRRWWYVVATALLVAVIAAVLSDREQKVFRAQAQVLLNRQDIASAVTGTPQDPTLSEDPARYAETQAAIARSTAVASRAIQTAQVQDRTPSALLAESSVKPSPTADVLVFKVDDTDPAEAAQLVNAYTAAFAAYRLDLATVALVRARRQLNAQRATLRANGLQKTGQYRTLTTSEQQLHTMQLLQSGDTVLGHPDTGVQVKPSPTRDGLLGLGFGLIIGLGLAFAAEALDRRVRSEEEAEEVLGLPMLARLPVPPREARSGAAVAMIEEPRGSYAEAVRRLATSISFANPDEPAKVLMVTSALQREGKSTTLANLGVALASAGNHVALVDLDLRQPALASLFSLHRLTGLTDVVVRRAEIEEALVSVDLPDVDHREARRGREQAALAGSLYVLPTGPLPASPGEFVVSDALVTRVLEPLRKRFDYVLVDTPPAGLVGDAARLSSRVDATVIVTRLGLVNRSALEDLKRQLAASPAPPLGFVVAGVDVPAPYGHVGYFGGSAAAAQSRNGKRGKAPPSRRLRA